jgi:hypothetical protein
MPLKRRRRIAIERRADRIGNRGKADIFGVQDAVPIGEMVHRSRANAWKYSCW